MFYGDDVFCTYEVVISAIDYQKNEETQKQIVDVDTQKIIPGLYYISWDTKSSVYRIETRKKYYFVIPYC